jgi:SAM-dependent methyltransferase
LRTHYPPTETNAARFLAEVKSLASRPNILVVGGGEIGNHARRLYNDDSLNLLGSDIYYSPHIDVIADGHALPMSDASLHGVWIQAVLEHVLEPVKVVSEIHRVLVDGGIVYAETPFLEAVHEGPYDFTRFSLSGHRWLFRAFEEIQSGCIGGPGTALVWSIRYFVGALFRNYRIGTLVAMMFFWISYMDKLVGQRYTVDSPSGTYFLGRRSNRLIDTSAIISYYSGAHA